MKRLAVATLTVLALSACGGTDHASHDSTSTATSTSSSTPMSSSSMDHSMDHSSSELPAGIATASSPKYPVGTAIVIHADHMAGMDGAKGSVAGAYQTTTYAVDYTPTDGSAKVSDHKWVVQEEIQGATDTAYTVGDTVTLTADHMSGMKGAKATIVQVVPGTVYAVDYYPTDGSTMVMGHLWNTEDELSKA